MRTYTAFERSHPPHDALTESAAPRGDAEERATGLEPAPRAWKALVRPVHHARLGSDDRDDWTLFEPDQGPVNPPTPSCSEAQILV